MPTIHRTLDGGWAECADPACTLKFHFPDTTVTELSAIPLTMLFPVFDAIDPPDQIDSRGTRVWSEPIPDTPNRFQMHREYGLPAVVWYDGGMNWRVHGKLHRDDDLPAVVDANGTLTWYQQNKPHRDGGKPASILPDGTAEYYVKGLYQPQGTPR